MNMIKLDLDATLLGHAARAIARLIRLCALRTPSPNDKLVGNICKTLCAQQAEAAARAGGALVIQATLSISTRKCTM